VWALRKYGKVGPRAFRMLLIRFGGLAGIHQAGLADLMKIDGLDDDRCEKIAEGSDFLEEAEAFISSLEPENIECRTFLDDDYPVLLRELNDPPPLIFYRGGLPGPDEKTVAIVGSSRAGNEGIGTGVNLASEMASRSISIVSGLTRGVSAAAHLGALKSKHRTYAVLDSGLAGIAPEENRLLASEIARHGGLISEYAPREKADDKKFPERNRLVAALARAVVIGEVFPDSEVTLDMATFCQQLGKIMFILIDNCDIDRGNREAVEKIMALGAIPVDSRKNVNIIADSLV